MTGPPQVSLDDLAEHVRDLRTALSGLCYALGRQPQIDAEQLADDLLEICLATEVDRQSEASELATLIGVAIQRGKADRDR